MKHAATKHEAVPVLEQEAGKKSYRKSTYRYNLALWVIAIAWAACLVVILGLDRIVTTP